MRLRRRRRPDSSNAPTPQDEPPDDPEQVLVRERLALVEEQLGAVAGSATLCSISKSAGSVPAAKYLEGRAAVLRRLTRSTTPSGELRATAVALRDEWADELQRATVRDMGPDWRGYRSGGVDQIDELLPELTTH